MMQELHIATRHPGLTFSVDDNVYPMRMVVAPRRLVTPAVAATITAHRDEYLCAVLFPPVPTDTPAQGWACSPWPGDELAPANAGQGHYTFTDEEE